MNKFKFSKIKKPIFIAEISANHNGSIAHAKKLIKTAKINNADFVKLQNMKLKYDDNSKRKEFFIKELERLYFRLYSKACTPLSWQKSFFIFKKNWY